MRSADAGSNVPGGHAIPQRLTHINSHNALASGHRTLEELLTALRKVARCIAPSMSVACRLPAVLGVSMCTLYLCVPCNQHSALLAQSSDKSSGLLLHFITMRQS